MDWLISFTTHPLTATMLIFILGAVMGSFLNVVIYRYPIMLKREWHAECAALLNQPRPEHAATFNLFYPRSHCAHCKRTLPFWLNIPIITYIIIHGSCAFCRKSISIRYLLVEILSALLCVIVFLRFGLTSQTLVLFILTWSLIALAFIDFENQFLPDIITYSLLWLGLFAASYHLFISPKDAIFGAIFGYLFLYVIAKSYSLLRKKEGMGLGDCKMLAMIGVFVGVASLLNVILLATFSALLVSLILLLFKKIHYHKPIPFGPFIAIGGWIVLVFNPPLLERIMPWVQ